MTIEFSFLNFTSYFTLYAVLTSTQIYTILRNRQVGYKMYLHPYVIFSSVLILLIYFLYIRYQNKKMQMYFKNFCHYFCLFIKMIIVGEAILTYRFTDHFILLETFVYGVMLGLSILIISKYFVFSDQNELSSSKVVRIFITAIMILLINVFCVFISSEQDYAKYNVYLTLFAANNLALYSGFVLFFLYSLSLKTIDIKNKLYYAIILLLMFFEMSVSLDYTKSTNLLSKKL